MQGIEFEVDDSYHPKVGEIRQSLLLKLVYKLGVTDQTAANYVLLGFAAACFGLAIFFFAGSISTGPVLTIQSYL